MLFPLYPQPLYPNLVISSPSIFAEGYPRKMLRRALLLFPSRFLSSTPEIPTLYSFLQPSIFAPKKPNSSQLRTPTPETHLPSKTLTLDKTALEHDLQKAIEDHQTDEAWKTFKILTSNSLFPSKNLSNSLISHLSSVKNIHNLKRAFATVIFVLEKNPQVLDLSSVQILLETMRTANTSAPAFALVRTMFKNRFFPPFNVWGPALIEICRKDGSFNAFLAIFKENCRIFVKENVGFMKPDLDACNAALEACFSLRSVADVEFVMETMSLMGVRPDFTSFGLVAKLYAAEGLDGKILELEKLMSEFDLIADGYFYGSVINGYISSGSLECASQVLLRMIRESPMLRITEKKENGNQNYNLGEGTYSEVVRGFLEQGRVKDLARLIIESQELESPSVGVEVSTGYGIINACVNLGFLDKAHSILDEMNAQGASVGLGVYSSILKAYCKGHRTTEAAHLVSEISASGLQLDASSYDALIDASMATQDFKSAFSLFRDMRDARLPDLKMSYLTIMTGLTENNRPELMAAFLDEIVIDPRVEVGTHDWNSIIHSFCKLGRLEDARRTFRRMVFLQFEPNEQTYLSLVHGYCSAEKYFSVLLLWTEVRKRLLINGGKGIKFDHNLVDAILYALVKGGFFDAAMQVVEKAQELKIFVDKWRYKQAFMETHKKLKVQKLRKKNFRRMEALVAFKNWAGLST